MRLVLRWLVSALAIAIAAWLVPGIHVDGNGFIVVAVMAVILGLANALVRPILAILTCPLIILTLGLFVLVVNALSFLIAVSFANWLGVGFYVDTFWDALFGSLIVSIVSTLLSLLVYDERERDVVLVSRSVRRM